MALIVKNNMDSVNALKNLSKNNEAMNKDLKRLSSGEKITSAADGASEYAISERMRVQVKSLDQDDQNAQNGISILNTAAGALDSTINILRTMKEKAIDSANDHNTDADRANIQKVFDEYIKQIDDNALVSYNGITMLDGSHNYSVVEGGTYTHLSNYRFADDTTGDTSVLDLTNKDGNNLGLQTTDTVAISWVQNGETHTVEVSPLEKEDSKRNPNYHPLHPERGPKYYYFTRPYTLTELVDKLGGVITLNSTSNYIGTDKSGEEVYTADGSNAITLKASQPGLAGQIAGITFKITDAGGEIRDNANKVFDFFEESISAENSSEDNAMVFQIGTQANQSLRAGFADVRAIALGLRSYSDGMATLSVSTQTNANVAINVLDNALQKVLNQQTGVGAELSRLEYTSANIVMNSENTQAAESVIRDADMAKEQTAYARDSILTQAVQAMLAQSNQNSSSVLSLLQ
ncbi:flagellin [Selenomonas sp. AB3002]|uniref:flagellin N-terminal helical domain-containing protein n=1 Tax=Selenomonas sp. AB3002 TaxID=1392502 RepID=UPI0004956FD9